MFFYTTSSVKLFVVTVQILVYKFCLQLFVKIHLLSETSKVEQLYSICVVAQAQASWVEVFSKVTPSGSECIIWVANCSLQSDSD